MITLDEPAGNDQEGSPLYPDLTTLLDILFILLVFFILTAGVSYRSLDLTLPSDVSEELSQPDQSQHFMLEIRKRGYALDGILVETLDALKPKISAALSEKPENKFIVAGDKSVSLDRFLSLLTYLQSRGIEAANILMKNEKH